MEIERIHISFWRKVFINFYKFAFNMSSELFWGKKNFWKNSIFFVLGLWRVRWRPFGELFPTQSSEVQIPVRWKISLIIKKLSLFDLFVTLAMKKSKKFSKLQSRCLEEHFQINAFSKRTLIFLNNFGLCAKLFSRWRENFVRFDKLALALCGGLFRRLFLSFNL